MSAIGKVYSLGRRTADVYRRHQSPTRALMYLGRALIRRVPAVIERELSSRRNRPVPAINRASGDVAIGMLVAGGVGDHIIVARFLRDLAAVAEPFTVDVFSPIMKAAAWVFERLPVVQHTYYDSQFESAKADYDLLIDLSSPNPMISIRTQSGDGKPILLAICRQMQAFAARFDFSRTVPVPTAGFLAQIWQSQNIKRITLLHCAAGVEFGGNQLDLAKNECVLDRFDLQAGSYVSIHNGFEAGLVTSGRESTKCYPYFAEVVSIVRAVFPGLRFVQLGTHTSTPIETADLNLINRTSLAEAAGVIAHAAVHVDVESGLVHVASCLGVPSCVVFGPTPPDYFGYDVNANMRPPVCGGCWWTTSDWMDRCPRGFTTPICLSQQKPGDVAAAVIHLLSLRLAVSERAPQLG